MNLLNLSKEQLESLLIDDISIQDLPNKVETVLIFICKDKSTASLLFSVLQSNDFKLVIEIDAKECPVLTIQFIHIDFWIKFETNQTVVEYPPLDLLIKQKIRNLSTGIWDGKIGLALYISDDLIRIGGSFSDN